MNLLIQDIMTEGVITYTPDAPVDIVIRAMISKNVGCMIVLDQRKNLMGIMTERDIIRKLMFIDGRSLSDIRVGQVMTRVPLVTVKPTDNVLSAGRLMMKHNVKYLPVIIENMFVGIITQTDIVHNLNDAMDLIQ